MAILMKAMKIQVIKNIQNIIDYEEKLKNVSVIQKKVCNGKFTKDAINKVLEKIKKN